MAVQKPEKRLSHFENKRETLFRLRTPIFAFNDVVKFTRKMCVVFGSQLDDDLNPRMVVSFISALLIFTFTLGKVLQAGFAHPSATNYITSACLAFGVCACNISAIISWKKRTKLSKEFEEFSDKLCAAMTSLPEKRALEKANLGRLISAIYVGTVFFVWVCYSTMPLILRRRRLSADIWPMPCDIAEDRCFYVMYTIVALNWFSALLVYAFYGASVGAFVQYSTAVFGALKIALEDMKLTAKEMSRLSDEEQKIIEGTMHERLDTLIQYHQFILRWTKEWTSVNRPIVVKQMIIAPLLIVSALIKMTQVSLGQQEENPIGFAIGLGTLYVMSAISDGLDKASSSVAEGAFCSGWEFLIHDREYTRKVQFIICRASRPTRMPGIIDDITLRDFVQEGEELMEDFIQKCKEIASETADKNKMTSAISALKEEVIAKNNAYINALLAH